MTPAAVPRSLPLILRGAPRERGRAHGEELRTEVHALVEAWEQDVGCDTGMRLSAYLERFQADTDFLPSIRRFAPDLLEEVDGIAEGAGISRETCRCLQCMDEHWTHVESMGSRQRDKCSTLAIGPGDTDPVVLGQNMDLPKFLDGFQTLLRVETPDGRRTLVVTYPGFIGLFGVGNHRVGVVVNAVSQLRQAGRGVPVAYVVRRVLDHPSAAQAAAWLESIPHASGQHYVVGDPGGFFALECCATGVVRCPTGDDAWCHTNHPVTSKALGPDYEGWDDDRQRADENHARTFWRLETLQQQMLAEPREEASLERVLERVSHRLDCPYPTFTFCSALIELRDQPRLHVALGRPNVTPYRIHRLA